MSDEERAVSSAADEPPASYIDTQTPHPARRYNYWLGGKDHFAVDRQSGDEIAAYFPTIRIAALENRAFMRRALTFVTKEAGVRQFLDIGTGIPAPDNTHEVAQAIAPESRVVYVDNDPIVMSHARALLAGSPLGATGYLESDVRDYERILGSALLRDTLDLTQPVALLLVAVLHFLSPEDDPYRVVAELTGALPSGSYLILSHATADFAEERSFPIGTPAGIYPRSKQEIEPFFAGMSIVEPGMVATVHWRAEDEPQPRPTPNDTGMYAAVARIP